MSRSSYSFSEDSALLAKALSALNPGGSFLEIGIGGGRNLRDFGGKFRLAVGTDILPRGEVGDSRIENAEIVIADRATCFRSGVFDVVAFNPPYLPSDLVSDVAVDGGSGGVQIPLAFLDEALRVSTPSSKIIVVLSSLSNIEEFKSYCERASLRLKILSESGLFFETLYACLIERNDTVRKSPVTQ